MTNFLENYQKYAVGVTDAPEVFHQFSAMATAGTVIGRSRFIQFGASRIYPNFYLLIIAPSSFYRKSTVLSISKEALYQINPQKVYPSDFSQEAMSDHLKENATGAFYWFEWKSLMGMLAKDYMSGVKSWLTELFDCYSMQIARKSGSYTIENPCVSIIAATTSDWFLDNLKSGDIGGGFLGRFIFVHSKKKPRNDSFPPPPNKALKELMIENLRRLGEMDESPVLLSPEARKLYDAWYNKFTSNYDLVSASFRSLFARTNIYLLKFALTIEVCMNRGKIISLDTMEAAIKLIQQLQDSTTSLCHKELSFSRHEADEKKVLRILREKGKLDKAMLLRLANMSAKDFSSVFETLLAKELICSDFEAKEGSQRKTQWIAISA